MARAGEMNDEYAALVARKAGLIVEIEAIQERLAELRPYGGLDARIALRPDERGADPMLVETLCDDIVVRTVPLFRAEQMTDTNWWVACYLDDITHDRICWSVTAKSKPMRIEWVTTEFPRSPVVYEHDLLPEKKVYQRG